MSNILMRTFGYPTIPTKYRLFGETTHSISDVVFGHFRANPNLRDLFRGQTYDHEGKADIRLVFTTDKDLPKAYDQYGDRVKKREREIKENVPLFHQALLSCSGLTRNIV